MAFGSDKDQPIINRNLGRALDQASTGSSLNQLRGATIANNTGAGIPKQVTSVRATVSNANPGSTSVITVTFRRDPSDANFSVAYVYLRGYNGNPSNVRVASGANSPISVVVNNTGENVVISVQSSGNAGDAPLASSPTTGIKLPTSAAGYGVNSVGGITGTGIAPALAAFTGKTSIGPTNLTNDATTGGSSAVTVRGIQTIPVSNATPNKGDILRYNIYGDSQWDIASAVGRNIQLYADANSSPNSLGNGEVPAFIGTQAKFGALSSEPAGNSFTSAATASVNVTAGLRFGWGASLGADQFTYGTTWRVSQRIRMNNTTNARYWIGTTDGATGDFSGSAGLASDAPTRTMAAFRYSNGTDTNIQAVCAVSGIQTVVNTGIAPDTVNSKLFEIAWVAGSKFNFYLDGVLVASIITHVPAASDRFGLFWCSDNKNTATAVGANFHHSIITMK